MPKAAHVMTSETDLAACRSRIPLLRHASASERLRYLHVKVALPLIKAPVPAPFVPVAVTVTGDGVALMQVATP